MGAVSFREVTVTLKFYEPLDASSCSQLCHRHAVQGCVFDGTLPPLESRTEMQPCSEDGLKQRRARCQKRLNMVQRSIMDHLGSSDAERGPSLLLVEELELEIQHCARLQLDLRGINARLSRTPVISLTDSFSVRVQCMMMCKFTRKPASDRSITPPLSLAGWRKQDCPAQATSGILCSAV